MEKTLTQRFSSWLSSFHIFLIWVIRILYFFPNFQCHDQELNLEDQELTKMEMKLVMGRLGILGYDLHDDQDQEIQERFGEEKFCEVFEEEEPSMDEVKEVFDVFDEKKDGYIDAEELQRVLCSLGLKKQVEECRRMIQAFDVDGDGKIDFGEFVMFMEKFFG